MLIASLSLPGLVHRAAQADRAARAGQVEHLDRAGDAGVLHGLRRGAGGDVVPAARRVRDQHPQALELRAVPAAGQRADGGWHEQQCGQHRRRGRHDLAGPPGCGGGSPASGGVSVVVDRSIALPISGVGVGLRRAVCAAAPTVVCLRSTTVVVFVSVIERAQRNEHRHRFRRCRDLLCAPCDGAGPCPGSCWCGSSGSSPCCSWPSRTGRRAVPVGVPGHPGPPDAVGRRGRGGRADGALGADVGPVRPAARVRAQRGEPVRRGRDRDRRRAVGRADLAGPGAGPDRVRPGGEHGTRGPVLGREPGRAHRRRPGPDHLRPGRRDRAGVGGDPRAVAVRGAQCRPGRGARAARPRARRRRRRVVAAGLPGATADARAGAGRDRRAGAAQGGHAARHQGGRRRAGHGRPGHAAQPRRARAAGPTGRPSRRSRRRARPGPPAARRADRRVGRGGPARARRRAGAGAEPACRSGSTGATSAPS